MAVDQESRPVTPLSLRAEVEAEEEEEEVEDTLSDGEEEPDQPVKVVLTSSEAIQASKTQGASTSTRRVKRLALISSEDLKTPTIAIPTIGVAAGSLAVWASVLYWGAYKKKVSSLVTFPIMTSAIFAAFTPVHDGTHSSIAKGKYKKPVNNLVGYLSGIPLYLPFGTYRQLHLMHHRYTNREGDPDKWDAEGPMVARFFKWFVPDLFWYKAVLTGKIPKAKMHHAIVFYAAVFWMTMKMHQRGMDVIKYWIIPQRAVKCWLSDLLFLCVG
jgi:fatty acid desaturase